VQLQLFSEINCKTCDNQAYLKLVFLFSFGSLTKVM